MSERFDPPILTRLEQRDALPAATLRVHHLELDQFRPAIRFAHESNDVRDSPRFTYDYCLALFFDTQGELVLPAATIPIDNSALLIVPPFVLHQFVLAAGRTRHVAVHFDLAPGFPSGNLLEGREPYEIQLGDGVVLPVAVKLTRPAEVYERLCNEVARRLRTPSVLNGLLADVALFQVLGDAIDLGSRTLPSAGANSSPRLKRSINQVMEYMANNLSGDLTIEKLSVLARLSPSHLNRGFRAVTGYPCITYLHRLRMMKARELLRDPQLSIKEIAQAVGYRDAGRFSKSFHHFDGLSPSQYRAID